MYRNLLPLVFLSFALSGCFRNKDDDGYSVEVCNNTCQYAYDGECDDGGPNSDYSVCDCGTDCADCGNRERTDNGCLVGSSSSGSSSGGSSSSSSGGSSSSGSSSSSSSGSSGSSSSGGPTYMPKGNVTITFFQNASDKRYTGSISKLTGNVEAPWYYPAGVSTNNYGCVLGIPGGNHNYSSVVYLSYELTQCAGDGSWYGEDSWMPSYDGQSITIVIGN